MQDSLPTGWGLPSCQDLDTNLGFATACGYSSVFGRHRDNIVNRTSPVLLNATSSNSPRSPKTMCLFTTISWSCGHTRCDKDFCPTMIARYGLNQLESQVLPPACENLVEGPEQWCHSCHQLWLTGMMEYCEEFWTRFEDLAGAPLNPTVASAVATIKQNFMAEFHGAVRAMTQMTASGFCNVYTDSEFLGLVQQNLARAAQGQERIW